MFARCATSFLIAIVLIGLSGCGAKAAQKPAEVESANAPVEPRLPARPAETPPSDTSAIDNLHNLATQPLTEAMTVKDNLHGFESQISPGFRYPTSSSGEVDFDKQNKSKMIEYVTSSNDASCRVAVFRVPTTLSVVKEKNELLQMAAQCAMSSDKENLIQVTKELGTRELEYGDAPCREWLIQANLGGKPVYARIVAVLISGPTFDTDRIGTLVYIDKTEKALDGENFIFFLSSFDVYKVKAN